jgi:tetratricopeptide (TPR) repeat protein
MKRPLALIVIPFLLVCCATAQTRKDPTPANQPANGDASIRGIVQMPDGSRIAEPMKVTLKVLRGDQASTYTDQQGRFEFLHVAAGDYTIEVEADRDRDRFEILDEKITVRTNTPNFVTLSLKEKRTGQKSIRDKTVSVAMLDQKIPSAAKREFDNATRLSQQGNLQESIAALQRALAIYPDYLMALNDLGAQLIELGRLDEALAPLRRAIKIDPSSFNPQLNLGIILVRKKDFDAALAGLDKALSAEPSSPAAHLYAGLAAAGAKDNQRAEREFKSASDLGGRNFSVALIYLGQLYLKLGEKQKAIDSLQRYLKDDPDGPNAALAKNMLAGLN